MEHLSALWRRTLAKSRNNIGTFAERILAAAPRAPQEPASGADGIDIGGDWARREKLGAVEMMRGLAYGLAALAADEMWLAVHASPDGR